MLHRTRSLSQLIAASTLLMAGIACNLPGAPQPTTVPFPPTATTPIAVPPSGGGPNTGLPINEATPDSAPITVDTVGQLGGAVYVETGAFAYKAIWSPDGTEIAVIEPNQVVRLKADILTFIDGSAIPTPWAIADIVYSPDGRTLAVVSAEQGKEEVVLYDLQTNQPVISLPGDLAGATSVAFSPDGSRIAAGFLGGGVKVWNVADSALIGDYTFADAGIPDVHSVAQLFFDEGGGRLAAYANGYLLFWQLQTDAAPVQADWAGNHIAGPVASLWLYPNDWSHDYWISRGSVISVELGVMMDQHTFQHEDFITAYSFSPDGTLLATSSYETLNGAPSPYVKLWNLQTGETLVAFSNGMTDQAASVLAFSPDQTRLLVGVAGQFYGIWQIGNNQ